MPPASAAAKAPANEPGRVNGGQGIPGRGGSKVISHNAEPILDAGASARLRDQLLGELGEIASSDEAAIWAHRILGTKNSLTEADARQVEDAFQAKLETLARSDDFSDQPLVPVPSASQSVERQPVGPAVALDGLPFEEAVNCHDATPPSISVAEGRQGDVPDFVELGVDRPCGSGP
jgi:hypothetical protein